METSSEVPDDTRRCSDEEPQSRNNTEGLLSTQEQLAELQLLTRADLQSPASSFTSASDDTTASSMFEKDDAQLNEDELSSRPRVGIGGLSSFTAILAASRKLATIPVISSTSEIGVPLFDDTYDSLTVEIPGEPLSPKVSGKSLPTLNEEAEGEEEDDDEAPETVSKGTSTSFVAKLSSSNVDVVPIMQEEKEPEERDSDDFEFAEMLEHLSRGQLDFLALTPDDLTARKLKRVHAALSKVSTSVSTMPYVRTLVSVDMLQLLQRRLGVQAVRDAIKHAMHQVSEREEVTSEMEPIALLTSCNITSVVLEARQELIAMTNVSPQLPRRTSPASSKHHVRQASHPFSRSSSSPLSSVSSSPQCGASRSPAADRRSILAKDGVHVLMQEKLVSYDHRGQTNALPAFRVRGASAASTDSAAKRRQRGLQYANDHISHRTVHM